MRNSQTGNATCSSRRLTRCIRTSLSVFLNTLLALTLLAPDILGRVGDADAQQLQATEAQVKAAFLFNFGKYVTWPNAPGDQFYICVLGQDSLGSALDGIVAGERMGARPVAVRRIRATQQASGCQVLFITASEESRLDATLASLAGNPALTVSDMHRFTERGGMIQFVQEGNRIRFTVNLKAAQKAGLTVSSELLKVAKSVQRDDAGGM